jgi:MFS family permease
MTRATSLGFGRYRAVLSLPGIRPLLAAAFVGRLPVAMLSLTIVLLVSQESGSYATAGAVSATQAIASAIFSPLLGRLIDRLGQTPVLVGCAIAFPISAAALIAVAELEPELLPLMACAVPFGISFPPIFASLRALLGKLAGRELTESAYAFEAVTQEIFFIVGPLLVAVLVAAASPQVAMAVAAAMTCVGTLTFAALPPSREWRAEGDAPHGWIGALASPGIRTLLVISGAFGLAFGTLEVTMPAFADQHGSAGTAGVLLAGAAAGSMMGGLVYGARNWAADQSTLLVRFSIFFAVALAPLALADSMPAMFVLLLLAGGFIAPWAATTYVLVGRLAPPGTLTEAFTWETTAVVGGFAGGGALSGVLIESAGVAEALLASSALAALAALIAWIARGGLTSDQSGNG